MVDWPGLLAWSTKYHDGTEAGKFEKMSDEDKAYLEKAMKDAFANIEDPNQIFKEAIDKIREGPVSDELAYTALELLERCCDDPDVARNIEVFDGLRPLLALLSNLETQELVQRLCEMMALMISNNPKIQLAAMKKGALEQLMKIPENKLRWRSQMRVLSAIVRNEPTVEKEFVDRGGVSVIGEAMTSWDEKLTTRSAGLLRHLIQQEQISATIGTAQFTGQAIIDFREADIQTGETLAGCAAVHAGTGSKHLLDALKLRVNYILEIPEHDNYQQEVEMHIQSMKTLKGEE